ncbi:hypothetical protein ACINLE_12330 [Bacillus sp. z60-18]
MKKCWLIFCLCILLAGCTTYKPKPKGSSESEQITGLEQDEPL